MATSPGEPRRDVLGSAAAVALLAAAAADVKRRGEPPDVAVRSNAPRNGQVAARPVPVGRLASSNGTRTESGSGTGPGLAADIEALGAQGGIKGRIDRFQASHRPLAFVMGVVRKFGDDRGGRLAALVSYYGFFSVFPALLAMTTILGFVLQNNPETAAEIRDSALAQFPVVGPQLGENSQALTGSVLALVVGIAGALWAGMAAAQAAQDAMNSIWNVPRTEQPSFLFKRLRSLAALATFGLLFAANSVIPQLLGITDAGVFGVIALLVISVVVAAGVFALLFRFLVARPLGWGDVWIGATVAAVGYVALQNVGALYINHVLKGAENTYGTFATVIGLLSWMFLLGQWVLISAEVNVVRTLRLWPRSVFRPPSTRADRRSQRGALEEAKLTEQVDVEVSFTGRPAGPPTSSSPK